MSVEVKHVFILGERIEIPDDQKYFLIDSRYFITYYRNVYGICTRNQ